MALFGRFSVARSISLINIPERNAVRRLSRPLFGALRRGFGPAVVLVFGDLAKRSTSDSLRRIIGYLVLILALVVGSSPASARQHQASSKSPANLAKYVDSLITQDSRGWVFNRYDYGSVYNASIEPGSSGTSYVIDADYTYNSGQQGWVKVSVVNGRFNCIEFGDERVCRGLRSPAGGDGAGSGSFHDPFGSGNCPWPEVDEGFGHCV